MTIGIGVYAPTWPPAGQPGVRWEDIRAVVRDVEAAGIDTIWVADEPGFWECWTILTAVAVETSRIEVGPLVANTRYRNPALFVTMVRALDEVSGGRVVLALGGGSSPADRRLAAFGFDGADGTEHTARNAEATEIVVRLLRDGPITFEGRLRRVENPDVGPVGPRPDGPPIWLAAQKPRAMAIAVRWADAVNGGAGIVDAAGVVRLREDVERACAEIGRDPAQIALTGWTRIAPSADGRLGSDRDDTIHGTAAAVADRLADLAEAGLAHVTCFVDDGTDPHVYASQTRLGVERLAEVLDRLRAG